MLALAKTQNPIFHADVPGMAMVRVDNTYQMTSTTMHLTPGLPIMKSTYIVNWKLVSYAYNTLTIDDNMNLENGKHAYGRNHWLQV